MAQRQIPSAQQTITRRPACGCAFYHGALHEGCPSGSRLSDVIRYYASLDDTAQPHHAPQEGRIMASTERPTTGVFVAWDEEEADLERREAGTVRDRTVVTARHTIVKHALWTNDITEENIAAAERYAESIRGDHENVRVRVFTGERGSHR